MNQAALASQCELCERIVAQLTRHHLVPRSRVKKRKRRGQLPRRSKSIQEKTIRFGRRRKAASVFADPPSALDVLSNEPQSATESAQTPNMNPDLNPEGNPGGNPGANSGDVDPYVTVMLCRPCHSMIHAILTHHELENEYGTLQALQAHPDIARFIKWVSRQSDRRVSIRQPRQRRKQCNQMKRRR
jgi:hypothetical protein